MKALLVNGSPRAKGCTYTALTELAKTLEAEGIETKSSMLETKMCVVALPAVNATLLAVGNVCLMIL